LATISSSFRRLQGFHRRAIPSGPR
jgi:hypothetical protein